MTRRMLSSSARAQGCPPRRASRTMVSGSSGIFRILRKNTASTTCTAVGSIRFRRRRSSGPIGAGISSSTAIKTRRKACTRFCSSWCGTRTILSSRRTSTTASRRRALTKSVFSTRRATTACFSAVSRAVRRRLTTRKPSARWSKRRASP